jgi:gamma-butyrobetaine dioxygenase
MSIISVEHNPQWLNITYENGHHQQYLAAWLRDNVGTGRHQSHGQRTFDLNLMDEAFITQATSDHKQIKIRFDNDAAMHSFDEDWLRGFSNTVPALENQTLWGAGLQDSLSFVDFESASTDDAILLELLNEIDLYGFALLENVPCVPETIFKVVDLFGYVRETNYGTLFDVRVEPEPANLAFTSETIGMHTDNPYRNPVPGLQLLHCLVNDSDGGENQLVDGFSVAEKIRIDHPDAFELLSTVAVNFRYFETGSADLQNRTPLISVLDGKVCEIRYNARSVQAFDIPADKMQAFYAAYRIYGKALHQPSAKIEFRLEPGQLLVLDNQRVLHGRSSYQQGARHLQGCYADKDSLRSKRRILEAAQ